jgi:hypothetical protein
VVGAGGAWTQAERIAMPTNKVASNKETVFLLFIFSPIEYDLNRFTKSV